MRILKELKLCNMKGEKIENIQPGEEKRQSKGGKEKKAGHNYNWKVALERRHRFVLYRIKQ